mgnify:CR=1 FL=1
MKSVENTKMEREKFCGYDPLDLDRNPRLCLYCANIVCVYDLPITKSPKQLEAEKRLNNIYELLNHGLTVSDISSLLKISIRSVYRALRSRNHV